MLHALRPMPPANASGATLHAHALEPMLLARAGVPCTRTHTEAYTKAHAACIFTRSHTPYARASQALKIQKKEPST
eukprot:scaffold292822_cov22-Tisochrysis_lutea.AAC.1